MSGLQRRKLVAEMSGILDAHEKYNRLIIIEKEVMCSFIWIIMMNFYVHYKSFFS